MTAIDTLHEVQARMAAAQLIAEFAHGIDNRDPDRVLATWHPAGVLTFVPDTVLEGHRAVHAHLAKVWAAYPELYHWFTNLSVTVTDEATLHGESRVAALCRRRSGATLAEIGTIVFECTRETGVWLFSSQAVTIRHSETVRLS